MMKVLGYEGLVRDSSTNAILNVNKEERERYLHRRESQRAMAERLNKIEKNYSELDAKLNKILEILEKR
jgi:hypothetical protein